MGFSGEKKREIFKARYCIGRISGFHGAYRREEFSVDKQLITRYF